MSVGLNLIIVGLVLGFGAFVFAAISMLRGVTNRGPFSGFDSLFKRHIGAMIVMFFGGLLFVAGFVIGGLDILERIIK